VQQRAVQALVPLADAAVLRWSLLHSVRACKTLTPASARSSPEQQDQPRACHDRRVPGR
jgi:hypothetical protein